MTDPLRAALHIRDPDRRARVRRALEAAGIVVDESAEGSGGHDITVFDGESPQEHAPDVELSPGIDEDGDVGPGELLTRREQEVLDLLALGLPNRVIAARLGISEHTVKFHLAAVFGKLGATTRTEAVRRALRRGLVHL